MDELFKKIYFDEKNPNSYGSVSKLYKAAKAINPNITLKNTENWLQHQFEYTLYKQTRKNFTRNRIYASFIDEIWEIDSLHYANYSRYNNGYKYLIMIIDVFSKYLRVIPVTSLKSNEMIPKFEMLFKKTKPTRIRSDRGLEFTNKHFVALCQKYHIRFYTTTNQTKKCAIVERVNRTIRNKIRSFMAHTGKYRYIDALKNIVKSYNHSIHRTINMKPIDVDESDEKIVFKNLYGHPNMLSIMKIKQSPKKYELGDEVRQKFDEKLMDKGYIQKWSDIVYKVSKVHDKLIKPQYSVEYNGIPLRRRFYPEELQLVKTTPSTRWPIEKILRKRRINNVEEVLVRYRGFGPEHDQWIPQSHLIDQ